MGFTCVKLKKCEWSVADGEKVEITMNIHQWYILSTYFPPSHLTWTQKHALRSNMSMKWNYFKALTPFFSPDRGADGKTGGAWSAFPLPGWWFCRVPNAAESSPESTGADVPHHHPPWCRPNHTEGCRALRPGPHCGECSGVPARPGAALWNTS